MYWLVAGAVAGGAEGFDAPAMMVDATDGGSGPALGADAG